MICRPLGGRYVLKNIIFNPRLTSREISFRKGGLHALGHLIIFVVIREESNPFS
jgi:hypothetical protein